MATLRNCINKAGKLIKPADGEYLHELARKYVADGYSVSDAERQAISDLRDETNNHIESIYSQAGVPRYKKSAVPEATPSSIAQPEQPSNSPTAPAALAPSSTPTPVEIKPFSFGSIIEGPETMDFRSDPRVADLTPDQLIKGIPALMKGNLATDGNRSRTRSALAMQSPDGRIVLAGVINPQKARLISGELSDSKVSVQRMATTDRSGQRFVKAIQEGGGSSATLQDVMNAGYRPIAYVMFNQDPGVIFETFANEQHFDQSWGKTDKTTGKLGKRILREGQPMAEAISQATNEGEFRRVEARIDQIAQALQSAQGQERQALLDEYQTLAQRQQELFDRNQTLTGQDELKYRTSAESAMTAQKAVQFQTVAARLRNLGARVDVFASEVMKQSLPNQEASGVQYSPWHIAVGLDDIQNANIANMVTLLHEAVHSLYGRLPLQTQTKILNAARESFDVLKKQAEEARSKTGVPLAKIDGNIEELIAETMSQRLAAEGISDSKSIAQSLIRWIKDMYYRVAMAIQSSFGREPNPATALSWIENQFRREIGGDYEFALINIMDKLLPETVVGLAQKHAMYGGTPGGVTDFVDPTSLTQTQQPQAIPDTSDAIRWNAKYRTVEDQGQEIPGDEARSRIEGAAINEELNALIELKAELAPNMADDEWWKIVGRGDSPASRLQTLEQITPGSGAAKIDGERMTKPMNDQARVKALVLIRRMQINQANKQAKLQDQSTKSSDKLVEYAQQINQIEGNFRDAELHDRTLRKQMKESIRSLIKGVRRGMSLSERSGTLYAAIREAENLADSDPIPENYQRFLQRMLIGEEDMFSSLNAIAQLDLPLGTMKIGEVVSAIEDAAEGDAILENLVANRPQMVTLAALARDNSDQMDLIQLGRLKDTEKFLRIKAELDQIRGANEEQLRSMLSKVDEQTQQRGLAQRLRTRYLKRRAALRRTQTFIQRAEEQVAILDRSKQGLQKYIDGLESAGVGSYNEWFPVDGAKWQSMSLQSDGSWTRSERTLEFNPDGTAKNADQIKSELVENAQWLLQNQAKAGQSFYEQVKRQTYELKMLDLKQEYPAQWRHLLDRMIQPLGDEAAAAGHSSGARIKQMLIQWQFIMKSHWKGEIEPLAKYWTKELQDVEKSTGIKDHGVFFEQVYDPVMYYLGTEPGMDEQAAIRAATRQARARLLKAPSESFNEQFKQLLVRTKEINETFVKLAEQYGVFVKDPRLGDNLRKAVAQGWLTNMRSMRGDVLQTIIHDMQAAGWKLELKEDKRPDGTVAKNIVGPTTFDALTPEQYQNPDALRQVLAPLFTPQIVTRWFEPFMNKPGVSVFTYDGRPISQLVVQQAWNNSGGDVVKMIDNLAQAIGVTPTEANPEPMAGFRESIINQIDRLFGMEAKLAYDASQTRSLFDPQGPKGHVMMDARLNELIPPEHLQFQVFDPTSARALLGTMSFHASFGRNGERMVATLNELKSVLNLRKAQWEALRGTSKAARMADAAARGLNYRELQDAARNYDDVMALQQKLETLFGFQNQAGPLGDMRAGLETLGFITGQVVNNPKTGLMNLLGLTERPITQRSLSLDTIAPTAKGFAEFGKNVFGSLLESMGLHVMRASAYAKDIGEVEGRAFGRLPWAVAMADIGKGGKYQESFSDNWLIRPMRGIGAFQRKGIAGPGESREFGRANVVPGIGGVMNYLSQESAVANGIANIQQFETLISRAMKFFSVHPEKLNDPAFRLTAKDLKMNNRQFFGSEGVFDYYRRKAVEYRIGNIEEIAKDAMGRAARGERLLTKEQALAVNMMAANELNMESSVNTRLAALSNNPILKYGMPLMGWPIEKMNQVNRSMKTADGQYDGAAMIKALGRLALWSLPMGIAFSLWMDKYDEKLLKKKSNLANVDWQAGIPLIGPAWAVMGGDQTAAQNLMGMLDRSARAGNVYGLGGDVINQIISPAVDPTSGQRSISLDQRVMVMSQFLQVQQAISNYMNQDWTATWASVGKPLVSAIGGNGALHGVDLVNNAFGLDNTQSRITQRTNVNSWLRSAGRSVGVELKRGDFGGSPTPVTVWVREMQLAAYGNDRLHFMESYRNAVNAARKMGNPEPEKAVLASWKSRDPLEVFRSKPTQFQMNQMYQTMNEEGVLAVREALNLYSQFTAMIAPTQYERKINRQVGQATSTTRQMNRLTGESMLVR